MSSVICPKCGKPSYKPYQMSVTKTSATKIVAGRPRLQVYRYQVYRHPDGRRRTPRKCTVKI